MTQEALEGVLQQQIVSAEGLYGWKRRYFKLEPSLATLDAYESESPSGTSAASHSLQNVRVAKVWGPNESGFDVFWKSGDSWSLLADDEEGAKIWVQYFNITRKLLDQSQAPEATSANGSAPVTEMTSTADDSMNTINMMNNSAFGASIRLQSLEHEYAALNEQTLREKEDAAEAQQHYLRLHRHKVTQVDQEANSAANSQHRSPPRSSSSANGVPAPSMRIAEPAMQTSLQEMMEENTALHRRETALQNAHERELETIMANHEGELLVLRNELIQERKRYTALWQKEKSAVDEAEDNEVKLRFELNAARESAERSEAECDSLRHRLRDEARRHSSDLEECNAKWEEKHEGQMLEYNAALLRSKKENETKITSMQSRFNASLKEMEKAVASAAARENDAEVLRVRAVCKKESEKDIEIARVAERRIAVEELERVKQAFTDRENATVADVQKLQTLHGERMHRYENQVRDLRDRVAAAEAAAEEANLKNIQTGERMRAQEEQHAQQLRQLVGRAEDLEGRLKLVFSELQQARTREAGYREELARSIETQRLQRAELLECRRREQVQEMEAHRWATVAREASGIQTAIRTSEQIARDEVLLLENELRRLKDDSRYRSSSAGRLAAEKEKRNSSEARRQGGAAFKPTPRLAYSLPTR